MRAPVRQLVVFGLLAAAAMTLACCGGLFLVATLLMAGPDTRTYSGTYGPYEGVYVEPIGPADRWQNGHEWSGRLSNGTVDPTGQGNDVISVGGEVLTLPN